MISVLKRPIVPNEHGVWVALLVPMLIGAFAAPQKEYFPAAVAMLAISAVFGVFLVESVRILLKRSPSADYLRLYLWTSIYIVFSAGPLLAMLTLYDRWGLIWLIVPGMAMMGLKLWSSLVRVQRTMWVELIGVFGLATSAPAAYFIQSGEYEPQCIVVYFLTVIWVLDRTVSARTILTRMRGSSKSVVSAQGRLWRDMAPNLGKLTVVAFILALFADFAPPILIVSSLLGSWRNFQIFSGRLSVHTPKKVGMSEMWLAIRYGLLTIAAWQGAMFI